MKGKEALPDKRVAIAALGKDLRLMFDRERQSVMPESPLNKMSWKAIQAHYIWEAKDLNRNPLPSIRGIAQPRINIVFIFYAHNWLTLPHEIGHVLDLEHVSESNNLIHKSINNWSSKPDLEEWQCCIARKAAEDLNNGK